MNAQALLYGGSLRREAYQKVFAGKSALDLALEKAAAFPGVTKIRFLAAADFDPAAAQIENEKIEIVMPPEPEGWTREALLSALADTSGLVYYAWADCPFLDGPLTADLAERHQRYRAEYSYADGWPAGLVPEILSPGTAAMLLQIERNGTIPGKKAPPGRDAVFQVLQRDINNFDIETEIAPEDLRPYRLTLAADTKRNLLLLKRLSEAGLTGAANLAALLRERPEMLRTLPSFYPIQVSGPCPQACSLCPYPRFGGQNGRPVTERQDFMDVPQFEKLLDRIVDFSGDAVIDLSLWGELALHPRRLDLVRAVLERPALSLVVETSGVGWQRQDLEALRQIRAAAKSPRPGPLAAPLSFVVSLDSADSARYREIRGPGFAEAADWARALLAAFPEDTYVQAVRVKDFEEDTERFYRTWTEAGAQVIIQKYDDFCGFLPRLQATDLSPVVRRPCWHLMRDFPVLLDGTVPFCREIVTAAAAPLGNIFSEEPAAIWSRGGYPAQAAGRYEGPCGGCDEYYTYNF